MNGKRKRAPSYEGKLRERIDELNDIRLAALAARPPQCAAAANAVKLRQAIEAELAQRRRAADVARITDPIERLRVMARHAFEDGSHVAAKDLEKAASVLEAAQLLEQQQAAREGLEDLTADEVVDHLAETIATLDAVDVRTLLELCADRLRVLAPPTEPD